MLLGTPTDVSKDELQKLSDLFQNAGYAFSPDTKVLRSGTGLELKLDVRADLLDDGNGPVGHAVYANLPDRFNGKAEKLCVLICSDPHTKADSPAEVKAKLDKAFTP